MSQVESTLLGVLPGIETFSCLAEQKSLAKRMLRQNIELSAKKNAIHEDISAGAPYAAQLLRWGRTRPGLSLYKKKQHPLDTEERIGYFTNPKDGFNHYLFLMQGMVLKILAILKESQNIKIKEGGI